ncbi:hypothetical protein ACLB2K_057313 [Fragaria x ananassa]
MKGQVRRTLSNLYMPCLALVNFGTWRFTVAQHQQLEAKEFKLNRKMRRLRREIRELQTYEASEISGVLPGASRLKAIREECNRMSKYLDGKRERYKTSSETAEASVWDGW